MFSTVLRNQDKNCSLFDNNHWKGSVATHPFVKQRPRSRRNSCPGELFCKSCTIVVLGAVLNHILKYCSQYRTTHTEFYIFQKFIKVIKSQLQISVTKWNESEKHNIVICHVLTKFLSNVCYLLEHFMLKRMILYRLGYKL